CRAPAAFGNAPVLLGAALGLAMLLQASLLGLPMFLGTLSLRVRSSAVFLGAALRLAVLLGATLVGAALDDQAFLVATISGLRRQIRGPPLRAIAAQLDRLLAKHGPAIVRAVVPAALHQVRG